MPFQQRLKVEVQIEHAATIFHSQAAIPAEDQLAITNYLILKSQRGLVQDHYIYVISPQDAHHPADDLQAQVETGIGVRHTF